MPYTLFRAPRHALLRTLPLAILCAFSAGPVLAATGDLDKSFGTQGVVTASLSDYTDHIQQLAVQPDGNIVALVTRSGMLLPEPETLLMRYLPNGALDMGFADNGSLKIPSQVGLLYVSGLALQADGKMLVAGYENQAYLDFFAHLSRYNPDGTPDASFGNAGRIVPPTSDMVIFDVAVQEDGRILITGYNLNYELIVARYLTDGTPDTSFGTQGIATAKWGAGTYGGDLAIQPDGAIIVVGEMEDDNWLHLIMTTRFSATGQLDTGFGSDGMALIRPRNDSWWDSASSIALQPDGGIVVTGASTPSSSEISNIVFARLDANGRLDQSFGNKGFRIIPGSSEISFISDGLVQPDGRIFGGGGDGGQYSKMFGIRLNGNGFADTSFSGDGRVKRKIGSRAFANAVAVQPDGKLVLGGYTGASSTSMNEDPAMLRYLANDADNNGAAEPWDLQPDGFSYAPRAGADGLFLVSEAATISGLGAGVAVPVKVSGGEYAVNGGTFTALPGYLRNGDTLAVRVFSADPDVCAAATVSVGGMYAGNSTHLVLGQESIVSARFEAGCP